MGNEYELHSELKEAIHEAFKDLQNAANSDEREEANNRIESLYKLLIDEDRLNMDHFHKMELARIEEEENVRQQELKEAQMEADKKKSMIDAAAVAVKALASGWFFGKVLVYERDGIVRSKVFQLATGLFRNR